MAVALDDGAEDPAEPAIAAGHGPAPLTGPATELKTGELVSLAMQMRARTDAEWQRAVNLHVALIAVMIFFANQPEPFLVARVIVFTFYSYNVVMLFRGLAEAYAGLGAVTQDLRLLPLPDGGGHSLRWLTAHRYRRESQVQCGILVVVWAVVGYLLVGSLLLGQTPLQP